MRTQCHALRVGMSHCRDGFINCIVENEQVTPRDIGSFLCFSVRLEIPSSWKFHWPDSLEAPYPEWWPQGNCFLLWVRPSATPPLQCVCSGGQWALEMDLGALATAYLTRATDGQGLHSGLPHPITAQMTAVSHYVLWKHKRRCIFKSEIFKCKSMRCGLIYN